MSKPKRYWIDDHSAIEDSNGKWVLHSDYAALAAENERLKAIIVDECYGSDAYRKHENEAKRLTAENKRLRKALKEIERAWYNQRMADVIRIVDEAFEEQTK